MAPGGGTIMGQPGATWQLAVSLPCGTDRVSLGERPPHRRAMPMDLCCRPLHPLFAAEVVHLDLPRVTDAATLAAIREAMDEYAVLVFRDQRLSDHDQLAFARRFDGELHARTGVAVLGPNRFGDEALTDISNVGADGELLAADDRRLIAQREVLALAVFFEHDKLSVHLPHPAINAANRVDMGTHVGSARIGCEKSVQFKFHLTGGRSPEQAD